MRSRLEIPEYAEDVAAVAALDLDWGRLAGKTVLVTGATGAIGSFLVDVLIRRGDIRVVALGRDREKAMARLGAHWDTGRFVFVRWDAAAGTVPAADGAVDYVLHLASNTHPVAYATDPIGTITVNVIALDRLLAFAADHAAARFLFASSNEIYGENRGDTEFFDESYLGYLDCNTLRGGYPEAKRCGEALCQAYRRQRALDCVIARLTRTYGPTVLEGDTKAASQFFADALARRDIVLKSEGRQHYSFQYVADSVAGLLTVLLKGADGEAYNIADPSGDATLRQLATLLADAVGRQVRFDVPEAVEAAGFSRASKARLDGAKLRALGWRPRFTLADGVVRTLGILAAGGRG